MTMEMQLKRHNVSFTRQMELQKPILLQKAVPCLTHVAQFLIAMNTTDIDLSGCPYQLTLHRSTTHVSNNTPTSHTRTYTRPVPIP
jgi:hypothetical protein